MASGGGGRPQASPAPSFFNAEEQDADDVYLNVNLQIYDAHTNSSALPSADQFAHALAQLTSTRRSRVNVLVTRGAPQGVRAGTPVTAAQASAGASGATFSTVLRVQCQGSSTSVTALQAPHP